MLCLLFFSQCNMPVEGKKIRRGPGYFALVGFWVQGETFRAALIFKSPLRSQNILKSRTQFCFLSVGWDQSCWSRRQKNSTISSTSLSSSRKSSTSSSTSFNSPRKARRCRVLGPALRENHRWGRVLDRWTLDLWRGGGGVEEAKRNNSSGYTEMKGATNM